MSAAAHQKLVDTTYLQRRWTTVREDRGKKAKSQQRGKDDIDSYASEGSLYDESVWNMLHIGREEGPNEFSNVFSKSLFAGRYGDNIHIQMAFVQCAPACVERVLSDQ